MADLKCERVKLCLIVFISWSRQTKRKREQVTAAAVCVYICVCVFVCVCTAPEKLMQIKMTSTNFQCEINNIRKRKQAAVN